MTSRGGIPSSSYSSWLLFVITDKLMQNMGTMDDVASPWMKHWGFITLLLLDERTVL